MTKSNHHSHKNCHKCKKRINGDLKVCGDLLVSGNIIHKFPCETDFFTDFREELSSLSTCNPQLLIPSASPAQPFSAFEPLDPNYCQMTSQINSLFTIASNDLSTTDDKFNLWQLGPGVGIRSDETFSFEVKAFANIDIDVPAAIAAYGASNFAYNDPNKDMRIASSGLFGFFVDPTNKVNLIAVCFFFSKTAVWAVHDTIVNFAELNPNSFNPANARVVNSGHKIADFDTSEEHIYKGEYDRKNRKVRFYIDGDLKYSLTVGGVPPSINGDLRRDWGGLMNVPLLDCQYGLLVAGSATAFRNAGILPNIQALEPRNPPFPPAFPLWNYPTSSIKTEYQDFKRNSSLSMKDVRICTYKSE